VDDGVQGSVRRRRPLGLFAIIAYALVLIAPRDLSLPTTLPLGRFTLEGKAAALGIAVWLGVWLLAIAGLAWRRIWGYRLGLTVFSLHLILVVSNCLRWLADSQAPLKIALGVAIWPSLQLAVVDALAVAYLWEHRDVFHTGRGFHATWTSAKSRYQKSLGLKESASE
jgi:hypothetical protein